MTRHNLEWTSFALGLVAGFVLKETLKQTVETVRRQRAHRESERTVVYDENLPDALERREPESPQDQPRYGGTGAIGFSPALAMGKSPGEKESPD